MDFEILKQRIAGRPVVVDENMRFSNLIQFLNMERISWREFRKGITDEEITRNLRPNEVVITADRRFAYALQEKAILVPLTRTHQHQIQVLRSKLERGGLGNGWNNVRTCPLCAIPKASDELTFWDSDHMLRHSQNPVVSIVRHTKR